MTENTDQGLDFEQVLPIFMLVLVDVLGLTVILPILHLYAAVYGASPLEIGLVVAAFPLAQLIGLPLMGNLSDRFGRKPLLLISQVSTCIAFIMLGMANSLTLIILSRVIDGIFGANISTAQAALSDITTEKTRAQGLGLTGAAFGLGFILGPVISLLTLEFTDNLAMPAFISAAYSFLSILLTLFFFKETLPPEKRKQAISGSATQPSVGIRHMFQNRQITILLVIMFAQQIVFFGFESLLGLFTLSRLGMLGQGNALLFLVVGVTLVMVQGRNIGPWSRKYGERNLVYLALGLLAGGLILLSLTPPQPHPFYVQQIAQNKLAAQVETTTTESLIGELSVSLPPNGNNGLGGLAWLFIIIIPVSVGAGLIRPSLNSLMTKLVKPTEYGRLMGLSASFVSAANAVAPILAGLLFQQYGSTAPFLVGGLVMTVVFVISLFVVAPVAKQPAIQPEIAN